MQGRKCRRLFESSGRLDSGTAWKFWKISGMSRILSAATDIRAIRFSTEWASLTPGVPMNRASSIRCPKLSHKVEIFRHGGASSMSCLSIKAQMCSFGLRSDNLVALHFKYDQARRRFVEWAQNEIAVVPDFHKRILFSDEAHFWLNGYVNKQNCRIWSEANPQVYVETPLHPEKLTVWCALWAGGILLQKR
ncbi:hypothetical protein TNCV_3987111 [Trichonephila clavipes]|nr:hypothetical protein TNCV_3987111 [Trichonephila clavipes]